MVRRKIIPLLLAGGAGARLWPVSRDAMPKQFLPLVGERSTYQQALARVSAPDLFAPPIVMTAPSRPRELPSKPSEFHTELLTEPDLILSHLPARAIAGDPIPPLHC